MKDIEWLKDLINEEGIVMDMNLLGRHDEQYWKNENIKINKGRLFYLIDQLDESEVLSQKWVDENVVEGDFRGGQQFWYGRFIEEEKVRNLLVPKQDKLVVPQFIADWYEENLSGGYTNNRNKFSGNDVFRVIQDVLETSEGFKLFENYGIDKKIATWAEENEEDFIHLIVNCSYKNGYEVEKEKRYYIINKENNATLMTFELSDVVGEEIIEFVDTYSENETVHFDSKEKAELIAHFVGDFVEVEEVKE